MRHAVLRGVLAACLAACSTASAVIPNQSELDDTASSIVSTTLTTMVESTGTAPDVESLDDIPEAAVFLAAVDQAVQGTEYEGASFDDPESYLGTGVLFCQLLERGLSVEEILTAYLLALSSADATTSEDDLILGGAILGAGIETLCPEYAGALEAVTQ